MDAGLQFAKSGLATVFDLGASSGNYDALVLSSNSRSLNRDAARSATRTMLPRITEVSDYIYKKIDSTLRGNIGPELEVLLDATKHSSIVVAPAYPAQGRSTVGGTQYRSGVAISKTEAANDPISPVTEDHIPTLVHKTSHLHARHIGLRFVRSSAEVLADNIGQLSAEGAEIIVIDAEKDSDLATIAMAMKLSGMDRLSAGSAGLAEHLVHGGSTEVATIPTPSAACNLVLAGSFSEVTRRQVHFAATHLNAAVYSPSNSELENPDAAIRHARQNLATGRTWIGFAGHQGKPLSSGKLVTALQHWLGTVCSTLEEGIERLGLVVTGGETGSICLEQMNVGAIEIVSEVQSGIAGGIVSGGRFDGRRIVTKAGAFGQEDAIVAAIDWLVGRSSGIVYRRDTRL